MSKKIIILIELVVCVAAIILVSVFGNMAESWRSQVFCSSLEFVDEMDVPMVVVMYDENDEITTDNNLCVRKTKSMQLREGQTSINLKWLAGPEKATDKSIRFTSNKSDVIITDEGLVSGITSQTGGVMITITTCDGSNMKDTILIKPYVSSSGGEIVLD